MQVRLRYLYPIRYWIPIIFIVYTAALELLFSHADTHGGELWIMRLEVAGGLAVLILVAFMLYYYFIARRLNQLLVGIRQLSHGQLEARIDLKDGDEFAVIGNALNQMAEQLAANLKQRRQAEEKLHRNTEVLQRILSNIDSVVWSLEVGSSDYLYMSSAVEKIYSYSGDAFERNPNLWLEVIHPEDRNRVAAAQQTLNTIGKKDLDYRIINSDGKIRWIRDRAYLVYDDMGKPVRIDGIAVDITETKTAQAELTERAHLAALRAEIGLLLGQRKALTWILEKCTTTMLEQLDVALVRIWSYNEEQDRLESQVSVGLDNRLTDKYKYVALGQSLIGRIAQKAQPYFTNTVLTDPELTEKTWAEQEGISAFAGYPLIVEEQMVGVMVIFSRRPLSQTTCDDLTAVAGGIAQLLERKRAEEALTISEERLRLALEAAQDGVWDWNSVTDKTTFSHQWLEILGYEDNESPWRINKWADAVHPDDQERVFAAMDAHVKGQTPHFEEEFRFRMQSGGWKWTLNRGQVVERDGEGHPLRIAGTTKDISDRKHAEEILQNFFQISPDLLAVAGGEPAIRFLKINPAFEKILGYSTQELLTGDPFALIHPEDVTSSAETIAKVLAHQEIASFENRFRHKDGSYRWISWQTIAGKDDGRIYAVGRDITATKRLSIMMEQTQSAAHVGGWELDYLTHKLYWTEETYCIYGVSPEEYTPTPESAMKFIAPEWLTLARESLEQSKMTGEPWDVELEIITAQGQRIWIHDVGRVELENGHPIRAYGAVQSINQRKVTEIALRQSEARNRALLDSLPDLVLVTDRDGVYIDVPKMENSSPIMDPAMAIGKRVDEVLPAPYGQQALDAIRLAAAGKKQILEHPIKIADGSPISVEARIVPLEPDQVMIIVRDITERKQMEEERYIRKIADVVPHAMFVFDIEENRYVYVNQQVEHDLGYTPEEYLGMGEALFTEVFHEDIADRWAELQLRWETADDGQFFDIESQMRHRNGEWRWFIGRTTVFSRSPDGKVRQTIGTAQDITEIKHTQQQLMTMLHEKDALLKEVHHRVKNNLQIISSLLNLQVAQIKEPQILNIFNETKNRVRSMALLHETLYRTENLAQIDFQYYVDTLCNYLLRSFGVDSDRIRLNTEISDVQLDMERAIPCGLIINELVSNALKYAFPDECKGQVWISMVEGDDGSFELRVRDDGIGLPPEFDAKHSDSLGLRLVHDLTIQLRGKLAIQSEEGAMFTIVF